MDAAVAGAVAAEALVADQQAPTQALAGGGANVKFVASITDDKGNALTLSNQASVNEVGGPQPELGQ